MLKKKFMLYNKKIIGFLSSKFYYNLCKIPEIAD